MDKKYRLPICIGAAVLGLAFSVFSHILLIPVLALAGYMAACWGAAYLIPVEAAAAAGMLLWFGPDPGAIALLCSFLLCPVILTVYYKKKLPHRYAVLALAVILCLGNYLSVSLEPMLKGDPPYAAVVESWETVILPSLSKIAGDASALDSVSAIIPDVLMPGTILLSEGLALALVLFFKLCHRIFRTEPRKMAKFSAWRLPKTAIPGCLIMAVGIALVYILRAAQANAIAFSIIIMIASLFSIQGLSYLFFVFEIGKAGGGVRVVLFAMVLFTFPYSLIFLSFLGIREQIQKRRAAIIKYLDATKEMSRLEKRADEYAKYGYIRETEEDDEKKDGGDAGQNE
ncbi:MAG: YybS family protein [Clostridiales bacterium]|nr:YybS family protein [Clostridiales bacterium]